MPVCLTGNVALHILHELVIKHHTVLPAIACLDPLPSKPVFFGLSAKYNEVRYSASSDSLESEIKHFLIAGKEVLNPSNRICGLKHLKKQVFTNFVTNQEYNLKLYYEV